MYYVIELTCIGPKIKEVFKSKELAAQYTMQNSIWTASSRLNRGATVQRTYLLTI